MNDFIRSIPRWLYWTFIKSKNDFITLKPDEPYPENTPKGKIVFRTVETYYGPNELPPQQSPLSDKAAKSGNRQDQLNH